MSDCQRLVNVFMGACCRLEGLVSDCQRLVNVFMGGVLQAGGAGV